MSNYSLGIAVKNIITNSRGKYYALMFCMAGLTYLGAYIAELGNTPEKILFSSLLAIAGAIVQEAFDFNSETK
jgi:hypothetical protein